MASSSNHHHHPRHDELLRDASHQAAIAAERAKCNLSFREELAPGLSIDMDLKNIHVKTHSKYQKVDVLETYFGKVRSSCIGTRSRTVVLIRTRVVVLTAVRFFFPIHRR